MRGLPDQLSQPESQTRCPGFILVPQCPELSHWTQELPSLIELVERWRNDPRVDKQQIYVTGVSMGGYGTWHLVAAKPDWFAAAVPICGGGDPKSAEAIGPVPIWAVHGDADEVVPVTQCHTMIEALRSIGASPHYSELNSVGQAKVSLRATSPLALKSGREIRGQAVSKIDIADESEVFLIPVAVFQ